MRLLTSFQHNSRRGNSLSGVPQGGDELTINNNVNGTGDNRNALALSNLQSSLSLLGGTASYQDAYGSLVADIAVKTRQAESAANTEQTCPVSDDAIINLLDIEN